MDIIGCTLNLEKKSNYNQSRNIHFDDETDLTNLNWLTEMRNQSIVWPNILRRSCDQSQIISSNEKEKIAKKNDPTTSHLSEITKIKVPFHKKMCDKNYSDFLPNSPDRNRRLSPGDRFELFIAKLKKDLCLYNELATIYENDITKKPPFHYSHIIGMAMLEKGRITLQQICSWIELKFAYFRVRKKWNNSIRHNLSLHYCFRKINRLKSEKGKGGYWELGVDLRKCDRRRIRIRKGEVLKQSHHFPMSEAKMKVDQSNNLIVEKPLNNGKKEEALLLCKPSSLSTTQLHLETLIFKATAIEYDWEKAHGSFSMADPHSFVNVESTKTVCAQQPATLSGIQMKHEKEKDSQVQRRRSVDFTHQYPSNDFVGTKSVLLANDISFAEKTTVPVPSHFERNGSETTGLLIPSGMVLPFECSSVDIDLFHPFVEGFEVLENIFDPAIGEF